MDTSEKTRSASRRLKVWLTRIFAAIGVAATIGIPLYIFWWESPQMREWRALNMWTNNYGDVFWAYEEIGKHPEMTNIEMIKLVKDSDPGKRCTGITLARLLPKETVQYRLEELLWDGDKRVAQLAAEVLLRDFRETSGLVNLLPILEADGAEKDSTVSADYDLVYHVMMEDRIHYLPPEEMRAMGNRIFDYQKERLRDCVKWLRENGKYVEWTGLSLELGYWKINVEAKKSSVPVRAWREIPEDLRNRWEKLTPEEQAKAVQEARERVGRVMELIDKL